MNDHWVSGDRLNGPIFPGMVSIISSKSSNNNLNSFRPSVPRHGGGNKTNQSAATTITPTTTSTVKNTNNNGNSNTIKSENLEPTIASNLTIKQSKSSTPSPSSSVLSLVKHHSSASTGKHVTTNNQPYLNSNNVNNNHHHNHHTNNHLHHAKLLNNQKKRYSCDQCSYSTDRRDLYRRHENIHRDEKPFRCYVCNKMFNRADHVKKHFLRIHKGLEYNVKLIKRINGVDYSSMPTVDTSNTANGTSGSGNSVSAAGNFGADDLSPNNGINSLQTFNLALWNEESNRLLFNSYGSQSVYPQSKADPTSQSQLPPLSSSSSSSLLQSTNYDNNNINSNSSSSNNHREPLGDSNGQTSEGRDLINLMNDAGLTLCLKLNGSNGLNGRTHLNNHSAQYLGLSGFEEEKTSSSRRGVDSLSSSPKLTSHVASPRSTPPTPSPSPPSHLIDLQPRGIFKGPISPVINENDLFYKKKINQENRRTPIDPQRTSFTTTNHKKSTSLLSPIIKSLPPPQTTATSLVKAKSKPQIPQQSQSQPRSSSIFVSPSQRSESKSETKSPVINNVTNSGHSISKDIVHKVDEMIKLSENEFNRRILESLATSSSSLLADRESTCQSSIAFKSEPIASKKSNWFKRLNPVRVNSISISNSPQPMDISTINTSTTITPTTTITMSNTASFNRSVPCKSTKLPTNNNNINNSKQSENKFSEEEFSESCESDGISIDELEDGTAIGSDEEDYLYASDDMEEDEEEVNQLLDLNTCSYNCEYCGCSFADYQSLHTHRYLLHRYINKQSILYPYTCVLCGKRSATQKMMISHMINHTGLRHGRRYSIKSSMRTGESESVTGMMKKSRRKQSQPRRASRSAFHLKSASIQDKISKTNLKMTIIKDDINNNNTKSIGNADKTITSIESIDCNKRPDKHNLDDDFSMSDSEIEI